MDIGRKIYFEKTNGIIVWSKPEISGNVVETTFDQDKITMPILDILDKKNQLGTLQLNYGDYADNFKNCKGYYVNTTDNLIVFL